MRIKEITMRDFPSGPGAKKLQGARIQNPIRELDPTCYN